MFYLVVDIAVYCDYLVKLRLSRSSYLVTY